MTSIRALASSEPEAINDGLMHQLKHQGRFVPEVIGQDVVEQAASEVLDKGHCIVTPKYVELVERVTSHEVYPDKQIDFKRSAHGVSFGRLIGAKPSKDNRQGSLLQVAFKPFDRSDKALQEMSGYLKLQEIGIETFDPVGVFPSEHFGNYIVVTKKRDDLMSLDRDSWIVGRQPTNKGEAEIAERNQETVIDIGKTFARLHAHGVYHPDGQIKNFAVTPDGEIGVIDTENLDFEPLDPNGPDVAAKAWNDIEKLVKSLIMVGSDKDGEKIYGVGMLHRLGLPQVRQSIEQLIIRPYIQELEQLESEGLDRQRLTKLYDGILDKFYKEESYPSHLIATAFNN